MPVPMIPNHAKSIVGGFLRSSHWIPWATPLWNGLVLPVHRLSTAALRCCWIAWNPFNEATSKAAEELGMIFRILIITTKSVFWHNFSIFSSAFQNSLAALFAQKVCWSLLEVFQRKAVWLMNLLAFWIKISDSNFLVQFLKFSY